MDENTPSASSFAEIGAGFRHARLQLGWSQELFAEKAIVSVGTVKSAESGARISAKSYKLLLDAINKARAVGVPPVGPLILPYPSNPVTSEVEEPPKSAPALASEPASPPISEGAGSEVIRSESVDRAAITGKAAELTVEAPKTTESTLPPPVQLRGLGDPPIINWGDDQVLLQIDSDRWRIKDACEGVVIFGATGSGKTSGSGQTLAHSYLAHGFGGLVLCAKPEESKLWRAYAKEAGRESDLVLFGTDPAWSFNFLEHESRRQGPGAGLTENIVNLFTEIASIGERSASAADPFWERAMKSLVRNCVELLVLVKEPVSLHTMFEVVRSAPANAAALESAAWRESSLCWRLLQKAQKATAGTSAEADCREVTGFWLDHFPKLGERTRGSIVAMFTTLAEGLMRQKMRTLFCASTSLAPEDALAGKIIVIDLPVKEWGEVGRIAAVLWKYCLQKAIERRKDNANGTGRPVFIWADECQYFVSRHDDLFQATARSSRASTVYLTQSIQSLAAAIGSEGDNRSVVDSLLNNLGTKVFHANSDTTTNEYASKLIGKELRSFKNESYSRSTVPGHWLPSFSNSRGYSEQLTEIVRPEQFARLRKGGSENGFIVSAVIVQTGRMWGGKWPYTVVSLDQRPASSQVPLPPPKKPSLSSRINRLLFPWVDDGLRDWKRWVVAYVMWTCVAPLIFIVPLSFIGFLGSLGRTGPVNPGDSRPATISAKAAVALTPIPVEVRFIPNPAGSHGHAIFATASTESIPIRVKVTSHPSGMTAEYTFNVSRYYSPSISGHGDAGIENGDAIEVSNPNYKPVVATFHHPHPFPPIPVEVKYAPDNSMARGGVYFTSTSREDLSFTVRITSHRTGLAREYQLHAGTHYSPTLAGEPDGEVEDGDVIEVSNPDYKPLVLTFRRSA